MERDSYMMKMKNVPLNNTGRGKQQKERGQRSQRGKEMEQERGGEEQPKVE